MLTVPEAARIAGRTPETIRRWIRSERLPARRFGHQHVIDEVDLDELLHGIRSIDVPDWLRYDADGNELPDPVPIIRKLREGR